MTESVQIANADFTFSDLTLANPQGLQGGAYFSKLRMDNKPVLIQTPKCSTKNGIHKTEKKIYCDLMFTEDDDNFINWIQSLETTVKNLIYEKRNLWFHNDMEHDSIDYHWQNLLRTYKGNKSLLRCFINKSRGLSRNFQIYNEEEEELQFEDVKNTAQMISILEVTGLKFTSQSFQIEFAVKQMMIIKDKPLFDKCLIKVNALSNKNKQPASAASLASLASLASPASAESAESAESVESAESDTQSDISIEDIEDCKNFDNDNHHVVEEKNDVNSVVPEKIREKNIESEYTLSDNITSASVENLEKHQGGISIQEESLDKNGIINEIEILAPSETTEMVKLKNPNEVYMEIYKEARRKAKDAKKHAIHAYLEAKRIKSLYLLDELESSDDEEEFEDYER